MIEASEETDFKGNGKSANCALESISVARVNDMNVPADVWCYGRRSSGIDANKFFSSRWMTAVKYP